MSWFTLKHEINSRQSKTLESVPRPERPRIRPCSLHRPCQAATRKQQAQRCRPSSATRVRAGRQTQGRVPGPVAPRLQLLPPSVEEDEGCHHTQTWEGEERAGKKRETPLLLIGAGFCHCRHGTSSFQTQQSAIQVKTEEGPHIKAHTPRVFAGVSGPPTPSRPAHPMPAGSLRAPCTVPATLPLCRSSSFCITTSGGETEAARGQVACTRSAAHP